MKEDFTYSNISIDMPYRKWRENKIILLLILNDCYKASLFAILTQLSDVSKHYFILLLFEFLCLQPLC